MTIRKAMLVTISLALLTVSAWAQEDKATGKYFDYQGYKVFYVEAGKGDPMVFLHNGGTSHRIWENQLRHFSRKYHVYAMDNLDSASLTSPIFTIISTCTSTNSGRSLNTLAWTG